MSVGKLALRVVIGGLFVGHGLQKLTGSFGGSGLDGTEKMMEATEMHPTRPQAWAAGVTEAASGALLALGAFTPVAAAGITTVMTTAVRKVHGANGPWNSKGGWEYNAVLTGGALAAAEEPGALSVDAAFGRGRWGAGWAIGALLAGIGASSAAVAVGRRLKPAAAAVADGTGTDDSEA